MLIGHLLILIISGTISEQNLTHREGIQHAFIEYKLYNQSYKRPTKYTHERNYKQV